MLEVRLLGAGSAQYNGQRLPGFPNQLPYFLLCYLLLNRQHAHRREQLSALFWADVPTNVSLKHLRNALWRLRHLLGEAGVPFEEYVHAAEGLLVLRSTSPYWLDVEVFEKLTLACQGRPGPSLSLEEVVHLEQAVDLYCGDLLEGLYQDWCLYDRERLYLLYLNSLSKLLAFHESHGNWERGLECGRRLLAYDDTRESTHRQMMRMHWQMGDRSAALVQYKLCVETLRDVLNVAPMEETEALRRQILGGEVAPEPPVRQADIRAGAGSAGQALRLEDLAASLQHVQGVLAEANQQLLQISQLINALQTPKDAQSRAKRRQKDAG